MPSRTPLARPWIAGLALAAALALVPQVVHVRAPVATALYVASGLILVLLLALMVARSLGRGEPPRAARNRTETEGSKRRTAGPGEAAAASNPVDDAAGFMRLTPAPDEIGGIDESPATAGISAEPASPGAAPASTEPEPAPREPVELMLRFSADDGDPGESVLAVPLDGRRYRLESTPIFGGDQIGLGDEIEALAGENGVHRFVRLVERSPFRRWSGVVPSKLASSPAYQALIQEVETEGGRWERVFGGILILHLLPGSSIDPAERIKAIQQRA